MSILATKLHVTRTVKKEAGRAKCILKCFTSGDSLLLTRAFYTFVRPILEYSSAIWSPYSRVECINKIEVVQRIFTKAIGNVRSLKYSEQLQYLNLDSSLQYRRVKTDLIMCYKVLHGLVNLECSFFKRSLYPLTWGKLFKLARLPIVSECDEHFY